MEKLDYLADLGTTAAELMPVTQAKPGDKATDRDQAIAIAISEVEAAGLKVQKKPAKK